MGAGPNHASGGRARDDVVGLTREASPPPETCCCNHGAQCTCGTKREPELDTVPESDSDLESRKTKTGGSIRRRRANTLDGQRPKKNSSLTSLKPLHSKGGLSGVRSADSLAFPFPSSGKSPTSLPSSSDLHLDLRRRVRSETASPLLSSDRASPASLMHHGHASSHSQHQHPPPLDLSSVTSYSNPYRGTASGSFEMFGAPTSSQQQPHLSSSENDAPLFSAALSETPVDWSNYEFAPHSSYSQAQSLSGVYDFCGSERMPTLTTTTSNSGDMSELDDFEAASTGAGGNSAPRFSFLSGIGGLNNAQRSMLGAGPFDYDDMIKFKFRPGASDPTTSSGLDSPTIHSSSAVPTTSAASASGGFSMVEDAIWMSTAYNDPVVDSPSSLPFEW